MAQAQPHMGGQKPMGRPSRGAPGPEGTDPRGGVAAPREAASRKGDQPKGSGQQTHLAPKTHRNGEGAQNTPGKGGRNGTTPEGANGQTGHGGPPDSPGKGTGEAGASPSTKEKREPALSPLRCIFLHLKIYIYISLKPYYGHTYESYKI